MSRLIRLCLLALWTIPAVAQLSSPINAPVFTAYDANGNPLAGGKLYSYAAGSSTPLVTYADAQRTTPRTNPVILDSAGRSCSPGGGCGLFLGLAAYKFVLQDANGVPQWTIDYVNGAPPLSAVTSVFGRAGAISAVSGDYTCGQITGAICSLPTIRYQTVYANGGALAPRGSLNLIGTANLSVNCADNSGADRTDCTLAWVSPTSTPDIAFTFSTCTIAQTGNLYNCSGTYSGAPFPLSTSAFKMVCSAMTPGPVAGGFNVTGNSVGASGFTYNWNQIMGNGTSGAAVGATVTCIIKFD